MDKLALFKRLKGYITIGGVQQTNAVYISPAQQLRNRADEIEQMERDMVMLDELINELEK